MAMHGESGVWLSATVEPLQDDEGEMSIAFHIEGHPSFEMHVMPHAGLGVVYSMKRFAEGELERLRSIDCLTFVLFHHLLEMSGGSISVEALFIYDLNDNGEFLARLHVLPKTGMVEQIECSAGDGVALALCHEAPIVVEERVLRRLQEHRLFRDASGGNQKVH